MSADHILRFPATLGGLEQSAAALRELLDARHVVGGPRYNAELAFEEVVANIVRHAAATSEIEVAIRFDVDEILMTFEDDGVPFDPRASLDPVPPASIDEAPVGGLGLMLLRQILTRMVYERTPLHRNLLTLGISAR
jgi:anti-sigma regulatory factor (Ser/Thr protein kinase)